MPVVNLRDAIENRRSRRKYLNQPLAPEELAFLLWCTQGVQEYASGITLRTVPSGGGRNAFETYLMINNVQKFKTGLYRYLPLDHKLVEIKIDPDLPDKMMKASNNQKYLKECAVVFIWVAVPYRMNWRFSERGYRYMFFDAGHVCQNLYLAAEAVDCGVCAIGAYDDDKVNKLIGIDGEKQLVIYMATVGRRDESEDTTIQGIIKRRLEKGKKASK